MNTSYRSKPIVIETENAHIPSPPPISCRPQDGTYINKELCVYKCMKCIHSVIVSFACQVTPAISESAVAQNCTIASIFAGELDAKPA